MQRGTFGQLWINRGLPEDLRKNDRVLDKTGIQQLFQEVAEKYPEKYRDILKYLSDVGRMSSTYSGSFSFGIDDLETSEVWKKRRDALQGKIDAILDDPRMDDEMKQKKMLLAAGDVQNTLSDDIYNEALVNKNPLALQVLSGARGNKNNLRGLLGSDLLYTDHLDNLIPVPVMRSFSQGLDPAEYFASTFGGRKGVVDVKLGTARAGYYSKLLAQAAHRLLITGNDVAPEQEAAYSKLGLPVSVDDADSEGALLSYPVAGYPRNTLITKSVLQDLKRKKIDEIVVRSPIAGGPPEGGLYARDVGYREHGHLPYLGEQVGLPSSQAIGEQVSQSTLSSKHSGGVAGASKVSGFKLLDQIANPPKQYTGGAAYAQIDGKVDRVEEAPAGGKYVWVSGERHFVPRGHELTVKIGQELERGDTISDGLPNPNELVRHLGIGEGRRQYVNLYRQALNDNNIKGDRRHLELLARGLVNHIELTDEVGDYVPGDIIPYDRLAAEWEPRQGSRKVSLKEAIGKHVESPVLHLAIGDRVRKSTIATLQKHGINELIVSDDPPPFQPIMVRAMDSLQHDPDWATRMLGSHLQKSTLNAVHRGLTSDPGGTSYVSAMLDPKEFGNGLVRSPEPPRDQGLFKLSEDGKKPFGAYSPFSSDSPAGGRVAAPAPFAKPSGATSSAGDASVAFKQTPITPPQTAATPVRPPRPQPLPQGARLITNGPAANPQAPAFDGSALWNMIANGPLQPLMGQFANVAGVPGLMAVQDMMTSGGSKMQYLFQPPGAQAPANAAPAKPPARPQAPTNQAPAGQAQSAPPAVENRAQPQLTLPTQPPAQPPVQPQPQQPAQEPAQEPATSGGNSVQMQSTPASQLTPGSVVWPNSDGTYARLNPTPANVAGYLGNAVNPYASLANVSPSVAAASANAAPGTLAIRQRTDAERFMGSPGGQGTVFGVTNAVPYGLARLGRIASRAMPLLDPAMTGIQSSGFDPTDPTGRWWHQRDEMGRPYMAPVAMPTSDNPNQGYLESAPRWSYTPRDMSGSELVSNYRRSLMPPTPDTPIMGMTGRGPSAADTQSYLAIGEQLGARNVNGRMVADGYPQLQIYLDGLPGSPQRATNIGLPAYNALTWGLGALGSAGSLGIAPAVALADSSIGAMESHTGTAAQQQQNIRSEGALERARGLAPGSVIGIPPGAGIPSLSTQPVQPTASEGFVGPMPHMPQVGNFGTLSPSGTGNPVVDRFYYGSGGLPPQRPWALSDVWDVGQNAQTVADIYDLGAHAQTIAQRAEAARRAEGRALSVSDIPNVAMSLDPISIANANPGVQLGVSGLRGAGNLAAQGLNQVPGIVEGQTTQHPIMGPPLRWAGSVAGQATDSVAESVPGHFDFLRRATAPGTTMGTVLGGIRSLFGGSSE